MRRTTKKELIDLLKSASFILSTMEKTDHALLVERHGVTEFNTTRHNNLMAFIADIDRAVR